MKAKRMPTKYSWRLFGTLLLCLGLFLGIQYQKNRIAELEFEEAQAALALAYEAEANGDREYAADIVLEQAAKGYYDEHLLRELVFGQGLAMRLEGHRDVVKAVAISVDGLFIASGGGEVWNAGTNDSRVLIWDLNTGEQLAVCEGHNDSITSVAFSPINHMVLSGSRDGTMRLWNWNNNGCESLMLFDGRTGHSMGRTNLEDNSQAVYIWDVAFMPDGSQVISAGNDGRLILWDVATGHHVQEFIDAAEPAWSNPIAMNLDGTYHSVYGRFIYNERLWVNTVAVSPDGSYLVSGADVAIGDGSDTGLLMSHSLNSSDYLVDRNRSYLGHRSHVISVAINPVNPNFFLSASRDGTIRYWNHSTGMINESNGVPNIFSVAGSDTDIESLAISPDGTMAAFGTGLWDGTGLRQIYLWDLEEWHPIEVYEGLNGAVWDMAFSPDGTRLVSAMSDGTVLVWNIRDEGAGYNLSVDELLELVEARFGQ